MRFLIFIRIILQNSLPLIKGNTDCQSIGAPDNSRRALIGCCWTAANYLARQSPVQGLLKGEHALWED